MIDARADVARWVEGGAVPRERIREALEIVQAIPSPTVWRVFLERLLLWAGLVAFCAALGFFIAANWQALGRFGKLALVEGAIVAALSVALWQGLDSRWGRAMLLVASLAVGTLLALVGQTYQTGADTWELFAVWAVAIAPWTLVARQPALWVLWIAIVDVAAWLYVSTSLHGALVIAVDERGIGRFVRRDDGSALAPTDVRLRYRVRDNRVRLVTNAWFFEEGRADAFAKARYGEFRVAPEGDALLARMLDEKLQPLGGTPGR